MEQPWKRRLFATLTVLLVLGVLEGMGRAALVLRPEYARARLVLQGFKARARDVVMVLNVRDAQPRLLRPPYARR